MQPLLIQWFLLKSGFNPGPIDNVIGPLTRAAIRAFQNERGLFETGTVTTAVTELFNQEMRPDSWPSWLHHALSYLGVEEVAGTANNPTIMEWAKELGIDYDGDWVAWCGLFVAAMLRKGSQEIDLPDNILGARNYLKVGREIEKNHIRFGDLVIFWRKSKSSWEGHVGFYMGHVGKWIIMLGGNQSQSVSIALYDSERILGIRRPTGSRSTTLNL